MEPTNSRHGSERWLQHDCSIGASRVASRDCRGSVVGYLGMFSSRSLVMRIQQSIFCVLVCFGGGSSELSDIFLWLNVSEQHGLTSQFIVLFSTATLYDRLYLWRDLIANGHIL